MRTCSRTTVMAVGIVLALLGAIGGGALAVGLTHAAWSPFHAARLEAAAGELEGERQQRGDELQALAAEKEQALAAARRDALEQVVGAEQPLIDELAAVEAERDAALEALQEERVALASLISQRDALVDDVRRMEQQVTSQAPTPAEEPGPEGNARHRQAAAGLPVEITNSIGMKFRVIPAGTFLMGAEAGNNGEQTGHKVTISKPSYLGVYEVTNGNGIAVKGFVPSRWKDADRPIESVTWDEAVAFAAALSSLPAERAAGRVYRLPTEAEWEYACRVGTTTAYSFGDDESLLGDFAWFGSNSSAATHPVGRKKPNGWGLYDMHGNVWEWCSDWHAAYPAGAVTDPQGPAEGSNRVLRGGGWLYSARDCRSASRSRRDPSIRFVGYNGFRLALSPSGAGSPEAGE